MQAAVRVKYNITPEFYAQIGAYNQNPSQLEHGNGFKLSGSGTEGTFSCRSNWSGHRRSTTCRANTVSVTTKARPRPMTFVKTKTAMILATSGNAYRSHSSKSGYWFVAQQQLTSHNSDASRGLNIAANATFHDKDTNIVDNYQSLMLVYKGPFDARPKDDMGIGLRPYPCQR